MGTQGNTLAEWSCRHVGVKTGDGDQRGREHKRKLRVKEEVGGWLLPMLARAKYEMRIIHYFTKKKKYT